MGFSILEWVAISPPRDLPDPGIEPTTPVSPAVAGRFFTAESPVKPTMESHLVVKRNKFESVELRQMNLEPVIQSDVCLSILILSSLDSKFIQ